MPCASRNGEIGVKVVEDYWTVDEKKPFRSDFIYDTEIEEIKLDDYTFRAKNTYSAALSEISEAELFEVVESLV